MYIPERFENTPSKLPHGSTLDDSFRHQLSLLDDQLRGGFLSIRRIAVLSQ
jgi:hypothetical protein